MPLTADRAKPAVPFGGHFRLIDFALSNMVNSSYTKVVVLTQYKSHSLDRHISKTWRMSTLLGSYVTPVPAQQRKGAHWYLGSADAVYQTLNIVRDEKPDYLVIVGADNIYRMDFSQMVQKHIETGAALTVAGIRQPIELADQFGILETDGDKISAFVEKPSSTPGLPDDPSKVLASMGNYVVTTDAFVNFLEQDSLDKKSEHDMGGDAVPYFVDRGEAGFYDFIDNNVPGSTDRDRDYWRDVGTLDVYYDANMDLISVHPIFNLYNQEWPTYTQIEGSTPPAKFVFDDEGRRGLAVDSLVSPGVTISGGHVEGSVLSPGVYVHSYSRVDDSVVMHNCRIGRHAQVQRAILDKNVVVEPGAKIGFDHEHDRARGLSVTESGIAVAPKGLVIPQ